MNKRNAMERKLTHGGYREGAGRPSICPEKKRNY